MPKRHSFLAKFRYGFDNFMSKGGLSVFLALVALFVTAIVLMAAFRFVVNLIEPDKKFEDVMVQWWTSFLQIADGGSIAEDTETNWLNRVVGITSLFLGMVLFSSLVAFITSQFEALLEKMRKGKSAVIEQNHTLILGFSDRSVEIIRELIVANESEKKAAVVVLDSEEKDVMDDFFREKIEQWKTTKIITRSGAPSSSSMLKRCAVQHARSIIILSSALESDDLQDRQLADAQVLKTILAILSVTGEQNMPPILAELHEDQAQTLARSLTSAVSIIHDNSILAKMMVQTSRISGLAQVYDNLVGFEGNEFYFYQNPQGWTGQTYGDLSFQFLESSLLGIKKSDGTLVLNPPQNTKLEPQHQLILLAEDDSAIKLAKKPYTPGQLPIRPAAPQAQKSEHQLVVGWSVKAPLIIDEYADYLISGSSITLVTEESPQDIEEALAPLRKDHPHITLKIIHHDIQDPGYLETLHPENFDNVILLTPDDGEAEVRDADTISKLLIFRAYFKKFDRSSLKTQLITEVADSDNMDVIREAGVHDFLVSNQFVSKIYAQVSEEPGILEIYEDLFREEGAEVYIKPIELFLSDIPAQVPFGDLVHAALQRGESAFGVRIQSEVNDEAKNFGIYINPPKNKLFHLEKGDCLITLAENET